MKAVNPIKQKVNGSLAKDSIYTINSSPLYKMADISQTTFLNAFSWMKMFEFRLKFHWSLFLCYKWALVQVMARRRTGDKPLPEPTLIQFTDAYMRH